jgi:integrase
MQIKLQNEPVEASDAYSLFLYAVRSPITRDYYLRRLRAFFNQIDLLSNRSIEKRCNFFAEKGTKDPNWAFHHIVRFFQFQKGRVERCEITGATLRNSVKSLKLFCEMTDIPVTWKKITRGLPKSRNYADDRAPTLAEIQTICEYPDRRIRGIVCTMSSSGIRLGAWDFMRWRNIEPIRREGKLVAAKIIVYAGDEEEYISFLSPEAYWELERWMQFRHKCGESIDEDSWVMRQLWNTKRGHYHHGKIKETIKLRSSGIKRLIEDALWTQGSDLTRHRYEFQTNHGFRKWFKTRCEQSGMKSINIETLMGHSIGISDSYYRITEEELLSEYLKAVDLLTINEKSILLQQVDHLTDNKGEIFNRELQKLDSEHQRIKTQDQLNCDSIASLSDQILKMRKEIESLKNKRYRR